MWYETNIWHTVSHSDTWLSVFITASNSSISSIINVNWPSTCPATNSRFWCASARSRLPSKINDHHTSASVKVTVMLSQLQHFASNDKWMSKHAASTAILFSLQRHADHRTSHRAHRSLYSLNCLTYTCCCRILAIMPDNIRVTISMSITWGQVHCPLRAYVKQGFNTLTGLVALSPHPTPLHHSPDATLAVSFCSLQQCFSNYFPWRNP